MQPRSFLVASCALLLAGPLAAAPPVDFNRDVRPILSDVCYTCHGPDARTRKADLRLDTKDGLFETRDGLAVVAPGMTDKSALLARITSRDPAEMMPPPKAQKRLTPQQIVILKTWIEQGARHQGHWAFQRIERPAPAPASAHPVDGFINSGLAKQGLKPNAEADRVTLIRRLSFDLTGFPPRPDEVEAFVKDRSTTAYETLVDRLLASPHFGERMAMFWLDLVRYADSVGYHGDQPVSVYPYRDWVIRAFNANMPFDRFTREQLAGDLLPDATLEQRIAAGYNRLGMMSAEGGVQPKEYLTKYAAERVRNLSGAWLGVTLGCAECHDHKFDPFSTREFYQMEAFFADIQERGIYDGGNFGPFLHVPSPQQKTLLKQFEDELAALKVIREPAIGLAALAGGPAKPPAKLRREKLEREHTAFLKTVPTTLATQSIQPRTIRILPRGNWMDDSGPVVEPAFPSVLSQTPTAKVRLTRLDLARWLVAPENPLTARALVNRLWKLYFGAGLSRKLDDLGAQGDWPTHPDLLDFLAGKLIDSGWDVKATIKLILTSDSYRRSSATTSELAEKDPFNRWLARQSRFRIDAELVRDHALAVSGLLVPKLGGPSTKPYQPPGYWAYLNFPTREWRNDRGENLYRRGLYTHWQRQYLHPGMLAFDAPSREECTAERVRSNTPLQALVLLNDPIHVEAARVFAERAVKAVKTDDERIDWLFRQAVSRPARPAEREIVLGLLAKHRSEYRKDPAAAEALIKIGASPVAKDVSSVELAAWTSVARAVLNLHATITRN